MKKCDKARLNKWCNNKDVKLVQLRSQTAGAYGTNLFEGEKVWMCAECRKVNCGGFKIVQEQQGPDCFMFSVSLRALFQGPIRRS